MAGLVARKPFLQNPARFRVDLLGLVPVWAGRDVRGLAHAIRLRFRGRRRNKAYLPSILLDHHVLVRSDIPSI